MTVTLLLSLACSSDGDTGADTDTTLAFRVVDTQQLDCYSNTATLTCPSAGTAFHGQDAQYETNPPSYVDNGDGTVTDLASGLMWQQDPGDKVGWEAAVAGAAALTLGGHGDWRLPTIKEQYSLILFDGSTGMSESDAVPYIDTDYFGFEYGDTAAGERYIDAQFWSSTDYVSTTMNGDETVFGVNFADGRIKGYPKFDPMSSSDKLMFVRYVRGGAYGDNAFVDNYDGTVSDDATGLTWTKQDSGELGDGAMLWEDALALCEDLSTGSQDDWRLPNAKELQSIVDYTRSPDTTASPAIDAVFDSTGITDANGDPAWPNIWSSTTHLDGVPAEAHAVYLAFGEAQGWMQSPAGEDYVLLDVHGAGAQRSDPKTGDPADYPNGHGPQGDVIYITNYARCVRGGL
jgi:hypothetical protein